MLRDTQTFFNAKLTIFLYIRESSCCTLTIFLLFLKSSVTPAGSDVVRLPRVPPGRPGLRAVAPPPPTEGVPVRAGGRSHLQEETQGQVQGAGDPGGAVPAGRQRGGGHGDRVAIPVTY